MANAKGRGVIAQDGSAVEVYRRFQEQGEAEFISADIHPGSLVLDLGAGTGRIAEALVALGHRVVAVDNSPDMLAALQGAEPVVADIETYRDGRRYDAVLLASHLINAPRFDTRAAMLTTIAHHLDLNGTASIQWHRPEWFQELRPGKVYAGSIGPVRSALHVESLDGELLAATVTYTIDDNTWSQSFTAQRLTIVDLAMELNRTGLTFADEHPFRGNWVLVRKTT